MEKHDFLAFAALLLFLEGYFFTNILPTLFGISVLFFLIILKMSFEPVFEAKVLITDVETVENEVIELKIGIKNLSKYPLNFEILENNPNFSWNSKKILLKNNEDSLLTFFLKPKSKGSFSIDTIRLNVFDTFGIFKKEFEIRNKLKINVYPSNESILKGIKTNKNIMLGKKTLSSKKTGIKTSEFDYLREYAPGDEFKRINWKASLKSGRLISKEFLKEIDGEITIIIDTSKDFLRDFKSGQIKTDYVSLITFQIAYSIIKNNKPINILFFNESGIVNVKNNIKSKESLKKCIKDMLKPSKGTPHLQKPEKVVSKKTDFLSILKPLLKNSPEKFLSMAYLINSNSTALIITDISKYRELIKLCGELNKKNSKMYIISPNSFLFGINEVNNEEIVEIYQKYKLRENTILKLNKICPTIDVGPNDLADEILGEV